MKIKLISMLSACSLLIACSSSHTIAPQKVVLTYGGSSVSAQIHQGSVFEATHDTEMERMELSGGIQKQGSGYLVDIIVVKEAKTRNARQGLNTRVLLNVDEPMIIGGINEDLVSIVLKH
jgi:hypothetical protein